MANLTNPSYNDIEVIFKIVGPDFANMIPEKLRNLMHSHIDPNYTSVLSENIPIESQTIPQDTQILIQLFHITYWAFDDEDRRQTVQILFKSELKEKGLPEREMTDEDYHNILKRYDLWNTRFGPIPFWEESMNSKTI